MELWNAAPFVFIGLILLDLVAIVLKAFGVGFLAGVSWWFIGTPLVVAMVLIGAALFAFSRGPWQ